MPHQGIPFITTYPRMWIYLKQTWEFASTADHPERDEASFTAMLDGYSVPVSVVIVKNHAKHTFEFSDNSLQQLRALCDAFNLDEHQELEHWKSWLLQEYGLQHKNAV